MKRSGMPAARIVAGWIVLSLSVPAHARLLRSRPGWNEIWTVASHAEISLRIVVQLIPEGPKRSNIKLRKTFKGRLMEITDAGITLGRHGNSKPTRFVPLDTVRTVRLMPVKGNTELSRVGCEPPLDRCRDSPLPPYNRCSVDRQKAGRSWAPQPISGERIGQAGS